MWGNIPPETHPELDSGDAEKWIAFGLRGVCSRHPWETLAITCEQLELAP